MSDLEIPPSARMWGLGVVEPGEVVSINCSGSGRPRPRMTLYLDKVRVGKINSPLVLKFLPRILNDAEIMHSYDLGPMRTSVAVECHATSILGESVVGGKIAVSGPGSPPSAIGVRSVENRILVRWQQPEIPNGPITVS